MVRIPPLTIRSRTRYVPLKGVDMDRKRKILLAVRVDEESAAGIDLARRRLMRSRSTQAALYIREGLERNGFIESGRTPIKEPSPAT